MQKRGQFFLVAALITVGILFGLTNVVNSALEGSSDKPFYDLSGEIDFETKRVLDHGIYYSGDTDQLIQDFLVKYADYIQQEKVLFVYGDDVSLSALYFTNDMIGATGISTGGEASIIPIQQITGDVAEVKTEGDIVLVTIDGITYDFKLLEGQNFFFVIIKEENDEAFVATGS